MRRARWAGVGLVAALVAGCGGPGPLTDVQLRDQATRICRTAARRTDRIPLPGLTGGPAFLGAGVAIMRPELAQLRALDPPAKAVQAYTGALRPLSGELALLTRARADLAHGADPTATIQGLASRLVPLETTAIRAWRALGIPACAAA